MKALFFSQIYPSPWEPTRGPYNFNVFRAVANYCEARVIAPRPWWLRARRRPGELLHTPHLDWNGLDSAYPTYWSMPGLHTIHARAMYLSLSRQVETLRKDFPFDVVLGAWMYPDAVVAARIARKYGCPLVIKILGSDINVLPSIPGLVPQIKEALGSASRIVTVSNALRQRVIDLGTAPERVVVQHNGVDGERFILQDKAAARAKVGIEPAGPVLCAVGRLGFEKGIDILLDSLAILKEKGRGDLRLYLIGHGESEADLKAQVEKLGISEMVVFCGMRLHDEVPHWISACDVLCLPSRREGCPNVVLEALASGRPVVAARVGGVPEILDPECGAIVDPEDPASLAEGILAALGRHWEPQSLRDSVECLSWDDVGRCYYRQLVESAQEFHPAAAVPAGAFSVTRD